MSNTLPGETCLVALSGGVDSAAAALLLLPRTTLTAGTLLTHASFDPSGARALAEKLGIPWKLTDLQEEFRQKVIEPFVHSYEAGKTPNPCVLCNKTIKLPAMLALADALGLDKIATGHYARLERVGEHTLLRKAKDISRDQSYFLAALGQDILSRLLLPLGEYTKAEVREIARGNALPNASAPDSQDICFIPAGDHSAFITAWRGKEPLPGRFVAPDGRDLGEHRGMICYTVGQRRGLGLPLGYPAYVLGKNAEKNQVTVGEEAGLYGRELEFCRLAEAFPGAVTEERYEIKIRASRGETPGEVRRVGEDRWRVFFEEPVRAACPGQTVALYREGYVLGAGEIL